MGFSLIAGNGGNRLRPYLVATAAVALAAGAAAGATAASASAADPPAFAGYQTPSAVSPARYPGGNTATPIKHLVVIFDEKVKPHDIPLILNPATGAVVSGGERRP